MIGDNPSELEKKFWELSTAVAAETGYELYDLEYLNRDKLLRVFIADKETGSALIEDCVKVDRAFTPHVEEADWIPDDFVLEVSSPGVYRNLRSGEHLESAVGERILVKTNSPLEQESLPKKMKGSKKVRGILKECDNQKLILDADGIEIEIHFHEIKKANLDPEL